MAVTCFSEMDPMSGDMEDTLRMWMRLSDGVAKPIGMQTQLSCRNSYCRVSKSASSVSSCLA